MKANESFGTYMGMEFRVKWEWDDGDPIESEITADDSERDISFALSYEARESIVEDAYAHLMDNLLINECITRMHKTLGEVL